MAAAAPPRRRVVVMEVLLEIAGTQNNATVDPSQELARINNAAPSYIFTYSQLRAATDDFNPANKLGQGTFGPVYKGIHEINGRKICVKELCVASQQGEAEFLAEVATMSDVKHRNVAILFGCCIHRDKRFLVYQYSDYMTTLDQLLFGSKSVKLDCTARYMICCGVAWGLTSIHYESRPHVHGDVKPSNILLNSYFTPQISDFGVAKLYDHNMMHKTTRIAGASGYLAREYEMFGHVTEKADVFSFGVLALEIITGKRNTDDGMYLLQWAWNVYENNKELDLVDGSMNDARTVRKIIGVALACTQASPDLRPSMSRVHDMLSGKIEVTTATSRPAYLIDKSQYMVQ